MFNSMKKFILVVALLAIGAITPFIYGTLIEKKFNEVVVLINESDNLSLETVDYKKGWLQSHAKTNVTFRAPQGYAGEAHMTLNHVISHGPIFKQKTKTGSQFKFAQGLIESTLTNIDKNLIAKTDLQKSDVMNFTTIIALNGKSDVTFNGDKITIRDSGNGAIDWNGLNGHFTLNNAFNRVQGEIILPGIKLSNNDTKFSFEDIVIKTENFLGAMPFHDLWLGKATISIDHVTGTQSKERSVSLDVKKINLSGIAEPQDNHVRLSGTVSVDQVILNDKANGPFNYSIQLQKVSPDALRFLEALNQKTKDNPAMGGLIFIEQIGELARLFLTPRPELEIPAFQLTTSNGNVDGHLELAVGGEAANNVQAPQAILDSIAGKGFLILPKPILKEVLVGYLTPRNPMVNQQQPVVEASDQQVEQVITELVQSGMLVQTDNQYRFDLAFKGTQIMVNGKAFAMPASLQKQPIKQVATTAIPPMIPSEVNQQVQPAGLIQAE
jgi:uncharacterized protein YdgA (DUF945 family)